MRDRSFFNEVGGAGGIWGGSPKKNGLEGGASKKIREKGGSPKILPLLEGGVMGKNLVTGGVMQLSNDPSKKSTNPPYLIKNDRFLLSTKFFNWTIL